MRAARWMISEGWSAVLAVSVGIAMSSALALTPSGYFRANLSFYWGPQCCVLGLLLAFRARPAVIAGSAAALAVYLAAFDAWARTDREGLAWLIYLFSFPGAAVGAVATACWQCPFSGPIRAGFLAALATLGGVVANLAFVFFYVLRA